MNTLLIILLICGFIGIGIAHIQSIKWNSKVARIIVMFYYFLIAPLLICIGIGIIIGYLANKAAKNELK